MKEKSLFNFK